MYIPFIHIQGMGEEAQREGGGRERGGGEGVRFPPNTGYG